MKTNKYLLYIVLCPFVLLMSACEPSAPSEDSIFITEAQVTEMIADGTLYHLNDFLDAFMTPKGNFASDSSMYRTRSNNANFPDIYLFSIDTLPKGGPSIYIRGRISTDDYAGNFYKSMVIQEIVNGEQQNLRISADLGSSGGMYQLGQEIIIRCNGLAVGRYANQPQLCVPSYNDNIYASHADEKVGWAPGRIPSAEFRRATRMIGKPDQSKLQYDEIDLKDLYGTGAGQVPMSPDVTAASMAQVCKMDGRLVIIKNVYFSGQYSDYGDLKDCTTGDPEVDKNANVFAPTTGNIGYPQGRIVKSIADGNQVIICSTSEYAKYATYYLPGADTTGVANCKYWEGSITGILGWYMDNAGSFPGSTEDSKGDNAKSYKYNWSVTPRGIPGIGISDINVSYEDPQGGVIKWTPKEYDPKTKKASN